MDGSQIVVDLSSDDEEEETGFQDGNETDYFDWLNKYLIDDETGNDGDENETDDDVVVVGEVIANPKRKKSNSNWVADVDDDDCVVLEGDPERRSDEGKDCDDESDELVLVGEKGQVACRDYPHSRDQCVNFPFKSSQHKSYCDLCHCYVCDRPAPCTCWGTGASATDHCHATDKVEFWKLERKKLRMEKNAPVPVPKLTEIPFPAQQVQSPVTTACNLSSAQYACTGSQYLPPQVRSCSPLVSSHLLSRTQSLPSPSLGSSNAFAYPVPVCKSQFYHQHPPTNASVSTHGFLINQTALPSNSLHSLIPSPDPRTHPAYLERPNTVASTVQPAILPHHSSYSSQPPKLPHHSSYFCPSVSSAQSLDRSASHPTRLTDNSTLNKDFHTATLTGNLNPSFDVPNVISQSSMRQTFSSTSSGARPHQFYPHFNVWDNNFVRGERGSSLAPCTIASGRAHKIQRICSGASGADPSVANQSDQFSISVSQQQINLSQAAQLPETIPYRPPETTHNENLEMLLRQASSLLGLDQTVTDPTEQSQLQHYESPISHESGSGSLYGPSQTHFSVSASTDLSYAGSDLVPDPTKKCQQSQVGHTAIKEAIVGTELLPFNEQQPSFPYVMSPSMGGLGDCPSSEDFGFSSWIPENSSTSGEAAFLTGIYSASSEPASLDAGNSTC